MFGRTRTEGEQRYRAKLKRYCNGRSLVGKRSHAEKPAKRTCWGGWVIQRRRRISEGSIGREGQLDHGAIIGVDGGCGTLAAEDKPGKFSKRTDVTTISTKNSSQAQPRDGSRDHHCSRRDMLSV